MFSVRQLREITAGLDEESWPVLEYLLEVADSSMTYRSRYFTTLQPLAVLDVLMADEANPRALNFQMSHLERLYSQLPRHAPDDLKAIEHALLRLRALDLEKLDFPLPGRVRAFSKSEGSKSEGQLELDRLLRFVENLLPSWADNVSLTYFNHARTFPISMGG
jgi:uncharacterized alpha-E superfamily protein